MKKLLGIVVLGLLFNTNVYSKNENLVCEHLDTKNKTHIIYNEKSAKEETMLGTVIWTEYKSVEITDTYLKFRNLDGDKLKGEWIINRYTGKAVLSRAGFFTSEFNCSKSKKLF